MNALSDDDMTIPSQKENTEEKILRSAFELYAQTDFKRFSLGNIAKRAGISKSAIFRYYKNKEALQNAMKCRFFDEFCNVLRKVTDASASKKDLFQNQLIDIITWFTVNKEYFCFFLTAIVVNPSPGEVLLSEIKKRDVVLFLGLYLNVTAVAEKKKKYLYRTGRYVSSAVLYFLLARISEPNRGEGDTASVDVFAQLFTDFLLKGWSQIDEISATRFAELDKLCETHTEEFPAENRIFCALAAVVKEYGYEGVTVERIAGELNMAKSSLYNYFGNKDELI
ncbi:MAG: TetR/AcrR family transcriptional regulator, partial [Spirochaetales bacterium]